MTTTSEIETPSRTLSWWGFGLANVAVVAVLPCSSGPSSRWSGWRSPSAGPARPGCRDVAMVAAAAHGDRTGERRWHTAIPCTLAGLALILTAMSLGRVGLDPTT